MYSLELLLRLGRDCLKTTISIYAHSSVRKIHPNLANFCNEFTTNSNNFDADLRIDFVWKSIGVDPLMKLPGMREILGEINIARYINRLIERRSPSTLKYESNGPAYVNKIDLLLEKIHAILHGVDRRKLSAIRGTKATGYILEEKSVVDVILEARQAR